MNKFVKKEDFTYDADADAMYIYKNKSLKYKGSIDIGDFVIDISKEGKVKGLEILNTSVNLNVPKAALLKMTSAKLRVLQKPDAMYIQFSLLLPQKVEKSGIIPLAIPVRA